MIGIPSSEVVAEAPMSKLECENTTERDPKSESRTREKLIKVGSPLPNAGEGLRGLTRSGIFCQVFQALIQHLSHYFVIPIRTSSFVIFRSAPSEAISQVSLVAQPCSLSTL